MYANGHLGQTPEYVTKAPGTSYVQIHPTCIPVHGDKQSMLTLMSESLRNDGRIWVPKKIEDAKASTKGSSGAVVSEVSSEPSLAIKYISGPSVSIKTSSTR